MNSLDHHLWPSVSKVFIQNGTSTVPLLELDGHEFNTLNNIIFFIVVIFVFFYMRGKERQGDEHQGLGFWARTL